MFKALVNYNHTPTWIEDDEYVIYDRSDSKEYLKNFDQTKIHYTENLGNVDYDKLSYLISNYHDLPDVFLWSKTNLFKYISKEEFDAVKDNKGFTPLLTQSHKTYKPVCFYQDGMYYERNNSWYLQTVPAKHVSSWNEWAGIFNLPTPDYIPFAPGGSYILTKERVHRYPRKFYMQMRNMLDYTQLPGEAQCAERSYYLLWS